MRARRAVFEGKFVRRCLFFFLLVLVGRRVDDGDDEKLFRSFAGVTHSSMGSGTSRHSGLCWGGRRGLSHRAWRRLLLSFCFGGNIGVESSRSEVNGGSEW